MSGFLRNVALLVLFPLSNLMLSMANGLGDFTLKLWREGKVSP